MFNTSRLSVASAAVADGLSIKAKGTIGICAISAALYPWLLDVFHWAVTMENGEGVKGSLSAPNTGIATLMLIAAFAVPLTCLAMAGRALEGESDARARRFALLAMTAPTAYVFFGVVTYMLGSKIPDTWMWTPIWLLIGYRVMTLKASASAAQTKPSPQLRVAHGIAGTVAALYVMFHVTNHLFGLVGPDAHAAVMDVGRTVYRSTFIEPLLVAVMLFQIGSGLRLAWTWSDSSGDPYRIYQIASGVFMSVFILGHMNSVFIFARTYLGIPTEWAFAAGLPTGLIHDPWNIRLLPHYALGVFFVLTHLVSGLRVVLLAHDVAESKANRVWWAGAGISSMVATAIMCGMTGLRLA
ncbi:hypothetical protein GVN17_09660 [Pseudomonas sp. SLFW]|nr:hypothetical protein [Pseudomonas sp. SLFW]